MKKRFLGWFVPFFVMAALVMAGCGEIGGGDDPAPGIVPTNNHTIIDPRATSVRAMLDLQVDLGDLVNRPVETWWYTRATAINDAGIVVGQSNMGSIVKAAFAWDPANGSMEFVGIHSATGFIYSEAVGINNNGLILANSTTGVDWPDEQEKRAFLYDFVQKDHQDLHVFRYRNAEGVLVDGGGDFSEAVAINNQNEIILTADFPGGRSGFFWDGSTYDLDGVPIFSQLGRILGQDSEAVAINNKRQAVVNSGSTAVFHDLNINAVESLNYLPGATETRAIAMNDSGHVVGVSGEQGFFWRGGAMYPMGHLGGGTSEPVAINNNDLVAGNSTRSEGMTRAVLWWLGEDGRGRMRDLGTLGGENSFVTGINDAGQVVGYSETGKLYTEGATTVREVRAFLWDNGVMYDLGVHDELYNYPFVKPFPFSEAVAINNKGEIAGNSHAINNHYRGFYLKPVFP
ncbi:DUF3466 family protein [Geoalkalibacter sp.]|uniref:DUF3466 family protein n=1 Tax=Geoalkalibacter sp. TaxID=3041440 RepID=UPI00272E059F|nr:DUF3466 family protein [Geoalkalibacter sp.]